MPQSSTIVRIAGSALAGSLGFVVGFYAGLLVVLSIWGLDAHELAFVFLAGGGGVVVAGAAIALTVRSARRWAAFLVDVALGVFLLVFVLIFNADAAAMAIGGLLIVLVTSILVRTGTTDVMVG